MTDETDFLKGAPQELLDNIEQGIVTREKVSDSTEDVMDMLARAPNDPETHEALTTYFRKPLTFNPYFTEQEWKNEPTIAGKTILGRLLTKEKLAPFVKPFIACGFDCSKFPDEPFINAAAKYQTLDMMKYLKDEGANIHQIRLEKSDLNGGESVEKGNALLTLLQVSNRGSKFYEKLNWLIENGVDSVSCTWFANGTSYRNHLNGEVLSLNKMKNPFITVIVNSAPMRLKVFMFDHALGHIHREKKNYQELHDQGGQHKLENERMYRNGALWSYNNVDGRRVSHIEAKDHDAVFSFVTGVETRLRKFQDKTLPPEELTVKDINHAFVIERLDMLDHSFWKDSEGHFLALLDSAPEHVKQACTEALGRTMTANLAQSVIDGPAKDWSVVNQHTSAAITP